MIAVMDAERRAQTTSDGEQIPVIELVQPMPGFPDERQFALVRLDEAGVLHSFRSLDAGGPEFVVVPPTPFYPDYAPEVDDEVVAELGIASSADVLVLLVVHAGDSLSDTTVNLRAPLLINLVTRRASQVVLDDPALPLAAPLVA